MTRSIQLIARDIVADMALQGLQQKKPIKWKEKYPYAAPYIEAMREIDKISDNFYKDSGSDIIQRFLCNANQWRGATARSIKAELKAML